MSRNTTNTVVAWSNADPDEISKRFHNMLLDIGTGDLSWGYRFRVLLNLFADWPPPSYGRYLHHDGRRSWGRR